MLRRAPASTAYLTDLARHEMMPQPLGEWVEAELTYGFAGTLPRLALAAALEGCCGIPAAHRETKQEPADRAHWLAYAALEGLHHWWSAEKRAKLVGLLLVALQAGKVADLLSCWCTWRSTERAKRRSQTPFIHFATETEAA